MVQKVVATSTPVSSPGEEPGSREERIRRAAYERFLQRGGGSGNADTDWREAEAADDAQHSSTPNSSSGDLRGGEPSNGTAAQEQAEQTRTAHENVREGYDSSPGLGIVKPEPDDVRTKSADGAG